MKSSKVAPSTPQVCSDAGGVIATYKSVPQTLKKIPHWLVWKYTTDAKGKDAKPPFDFRTGKVGDSSDPAVWTDFETASKAADPLRSKIYYDGIGFSIKDTDLVGIDFDGVIDAEGVIDPYVINILPLTTTYLKVRHSCQERGEPQPGVVAVSHALR